MSENVEFFPCAIFVLLPALNFAPILKRWAIFLDPICTRLDHFENVSLEGSELIRLSVSTRVKGRCIRVKSEPVSCKRALGH